MKVIDEVALTLVKEMKGMIFSNIKFNNFRVWKRRHEY